MASANKKTTPQPSAKPAASKAKKADCSANKTSEKVIQFGNSAMQEFLSTGTGEAQKAQETIVSFSRESVENLSKSADKVSKATLEAIAMSRDNIETCVECGSISASLAKNVSAEIFENANKAFSDSVELSKNFFSCRTINDMTELQNRTVKNSMDNFFNQSMAISNMVFDYSSEALEPINERVSTATKQINKTLSS